MEKLLRLARIEVSDEEKKELTHDIEGILGYVSEVEKASVLESDTTALGELVNVMREDGEPHATSLHTEKLLAEAPQTERGYIKVKKIL